MATECKLTYRVIFVHPFMVIKHFVGVGWVTIGPLEAVDEHQTTIVRHDSALDAELYVLERGGVTEYDVMWSGL